MMSASILLQNGTILTHDDHDHVVPLHETDVVICGNIITAIGKDLRSNLVGEVEIIDCRGKIVSPGYVDTHHHVWQTQLKGRHAEEGLVAYMVTVSSAVDATADSGIRSIFAYAILVRMTEWNQPTCVIDEDLMADWAFAQIEQLASKYNTLEPSHRIEIGYGFDWWFLPKEVSLNIFKRLRKSGARLVTSHVGKTGFQGMQIGVSMLQSHGILRAPYSRSDQTPELPFFVFSHCNGYSDEELSVLSSTGTSVSSTPGTESQMGIGYPVALHPALNTPARSAHVGLGIDCHSIVPSSIVLQARALLNLTRVEHNSHITAAGKFPTWKVRNTSEDVFNIATIRGARSLGLDGEIGSIKVGKKADIVVFDAVNNVGMLSAAEYDPVVAIIRFSEAADIDTVVVNGIIRKRDGRLVDVDVKTSATKDTRMSWQEVAQIVRHSQREIQTRIDGIDIQKGKETLFHTFRTDDSTLVDATV